MVSQPRAHRPPPRRRAPRRQGRRKYERATRSSVCWSWPLSPQRATSSRSGSVATAVLVHRGPGGAVSV